MSATRLWQLNPAMHAAGISKVDAAMLSFEELAAQWMARPSEFEELETGFLPLTERQQRTQVNADSEAKRNKSEMILRQKVHRQRPRHAKRHKPPYETTRDNHLMQVI